MQRRAPSWTTVLFGPGVVPSDTGEATRMDHLGVEVESTDAVHPATTRLADQDLTTDVENDTTCCYAVQDKV